jgi:predicted RNase H-like HicB family nuclease
MKYVYPAIFKPNSSEGGYDVEVPDLPGCYTCADTFAEAIEMAEDATTQWLWDAENHNEPIPPASKIKCEEPNFVTYIRADTDAFRKQMKDYAVKKTLTIPAWLNQKAMDAHVNFSGVLQQALKEHLCIAEQ